MVLRTFYLVGRPESSTRQLEIGEPAALEDLRPGIAAVYNILRPADIRFHKGDTALENIENIEQLLVCEAVGITIAGHPVREPQQPVGIPGFGNHFEIYPDHLGNHQRLFNKYGGVIRTDNLGRVTYLTNDPDITVLAFRDGEYFTKAPSAPSHPLFGIRDETALFLCDTDSRAWQEAHRFIPPSMTPRAVRHYTPLLQRSVEKAFLVLDTFDENGEALNVYHLTAKLASQVICQLVLGVDLHHFDAVDSPMHRIIVLLQQYLTLNRRVQTKGAWYSYLPFGDPVALKNTRKELYGLIEQAVMACRNHNGTTDDLPIQTAALHASCLVDYLARATDERGCKLRHEYILSNTLALVGAGFVTSSSFLAWLIYSLVTYPGQQDRLLQELVNHGATLDKNWSYDEIQAMPFLDAFVKETQQRRRSPGGWALPQGSILILSIPHLHRHAAYWENADRFDADRWATEGVSNRHRSVYVPFAAGARGCIGFNVALQEVKVALAELVYRYEFVNATDEAIEYDPDFIVIRPLNFYVRAIRRSSWPARSTA
ncbi:cytochrome P450 [Aspergillus candidus]|uniref:Cytochrome P450 82A2 n=1 Tax=Aspergillus candidus TaxID=41067 RepID=A0A2I2FGG2_ASPCN|nr:cytochrome P450 82A2 [Aspergillus candidus]PLB39704.1 cytochrome P450 82A2 [Aspergillus candidus]